MTKEVHQRAVASLVQELSYELNRFSDLFARAHGLHPTDVHALAHLHQSALRGVAVTPTHLATSIGLSPPATSALLHRMVESGHLERRPDPDDGRRQQVVLHTSAQELAREFFGPLGQALRSSMDGMDQASIEIVETWLSRAIAAARDTADEVTRTND